MKITISRKKKKWIFLLAVLVILTVGIFVVKAIWFGSNEEMYRVELEKSDIIDITISQDQQAKLNRYLKKTPVKKKWVKVGFKFDGNYHSAKMRFHGTSAAHFTGGKYSYSIKLFKDSAYYNNARKFKLIKSEEADPTVIAINKMANSLGLISSSGSMKILRVNGEIKGTYYLVEDIKKEFLEREFGITSYSTLTNVSDWNRKENVSLGINHVSDNDLYFGHIEEDDDFEYPKALNEYRILTKHIKNGNLEEVKKRIDVEYMSKFLCLLAVFNDIHFVTGDNLKLIYDQSRGKFYPIYRAECEGREIAIKESVSFPHLNKFVFHSLGDLYFKSKNTKLFQLLLTDNEIRNLRDARLYDYATQRNSILNPLKKVYAANDRVMRYFKTDFELCEPKKKKQIKIVNSVLDIAKQHLEYSQIYVTYDSISQRLDILLDSYAPLHISHRTSDFRKENVNGIQMSQDMDAEYLHQEFEVNDYNFDPKGLVFVNSITKDTISKKKIYLNLIDRSGGDTSKSTEELLNENNVSYSIKNDSLIIQKGMYSITSHLVIESKYTTIIEAGVHFKIDSAVNFCMYGDVDMRGSSINNIIIDRLDDKCSFGSVSIVGVDHVSHSKISYLNISGGGESFFDGRSYTGQFAVYHADVKIEHSVFSNSEGDDGLNVKYSKVNIMDCKFLNNMADQVDLDFCIVQLSECEFKPSAIDPNGDGLDLSGSYASITNCTFSGFLDKGLSLGEKSKVIVTACVFKENNNAIAVKDETIVYTWENNFESNTNDFISYIKKSIFNDPILVIPSESSISTSILNGERRVMDADILKKEMNLFDFEYQKFVAITGLSSKLQLNQLISAR